MSLLSIVKTKVIAKRWIENHSTDFGYEYTTHSGDLRAHIDAVYDKNKGTLQLTWFWVHPRFRGCGIGRNLLSKVINEALKMPAFTKVIVFPHPDPKLDSEREMTVEDLVLRYQHLGFVFINGHNATDGMDLLIRQ